MGIGLVKVCDGNKEWFKKTDFIKETGPNWMRFWTDVFYWLFASSTVQRGMFG